MGNEATSKFYHVSMVIVKVNHRCNLSCEYCYEDIQPGSDLEIKQLLNLAHEVLSQTSAPVVQFVFHGGEPTLADLGWYIFAVGCINHAATQYGKAARFSMQTNLVKVTDAQAELFRDLRIRLSASIDGPDPEKTQQRQLAERVKKNYLRLRSMGIHVGLLANINEGNWDRTDRLIAWLREDLQVTRIKANLAYQVGRARSKCNLPPEQAFAAQKQFLLHLLQTHGRGLIEDNTSYELLRYMGQVPSGLGAESWRCMARQCGAGKTVISISPNGDILPCGRFQWNDASFALTKVGFEGDDGAVREKVDGFHLLNQENWKDCATCEARGVCSFGCQAFIVRSASKANIECIPTRLRYQFMQENRSEFAALVDTLSRRLGVSGRQAA
ncbi:radical SAM protein [Cereibacter sphaeroides f. sp. denitrificans]